MVQLFKDLHDHEGTDVFGALLEPALRPLAQFPKTFARFGRLATSPPGDGVSNDELWTLYALSRISDILLLGFQLLPSIVPDHAGDRWAGPGATVQGYLRFFGALGMVPVQTNRFSPFFHEVVDVIEDPACDHVMIQDVVWPGLSFGHMLFARAGVRVRCRQGLLDPHLARQTTLYFTYRRRYRPATDLSHGWGHNSQWRTEFRRDYAEEGMLHYNVNGTISLNDPDVAPIREDDLTRAERIELLTHRCLVITAKSDSERWPYADRYEAPGSPTAED